MTRPTELWVRRGPRILVAIVLLFAVGGLFGVLVVQLRSANSADADFVAAERHGVAYLRPLSRLLVELTRAQSAAVRATAVESVALNAAVAGVSEADRAYGSALRTERRWTDLRGEIEKTATERPSGAAALARYTDLITLTNDLARRVGDTSNLILDPQLDTFYLMETALLQLPQVLTATGLAADHAYLATVEDADSDEEVAALVDVAVARHQVATATDAIGIGLRKAMDETSRSAMGPSLTEPLDAFRSAVDQLAPPAALRQADIPSAGNLSTAAQRVREAALPLSGAVLGELDTLLADRQNALALQRTYGLTAAAAGVLLGVVLLWWSVPARGRGDDIAGLRDDAAQRMDVASVSVQLPAVDARDLLAIEELVHVGRGVRARPKDEAGDAQ